MKRQIDQAVRDVRAAAKLGGWMTVDTFRARTGSVYIHFLHLRRALVQVRIADHPCNFGFAMKTLHVRVDIDPAATDVVKFLNRDARRAAKTPSFARDARAARDSRPL